MCVPQSRAKWQGLHCDRGVPRGPRAVMADSSNVLQVKVDGFLGGVCLSRYREGRQTQSLHCVESLDTVKSRPTIWTWLVVSKQCLGCLVTMQ